MTDTDSGAMTPPTRTGPPVVAIAAVARNGVIGADNTIPWRLPEDMRRFKRLTMGQVLVMGRRTFDSIGRALPGRTTVVVTRDKMWRGDNVLALPSIEEALERADQLADGTVFVAGGGEVYRAAWDRLTGLEITEVDQDVAGDVVFPSIDPREWAETAREDHDGYSYVSYRRRAG